MSVSYPKGMMPPVPAPMSQPVKAKAAPSGGFAKALTHHGHVGAALKAGNASKAMHHIGHMMLAVRNASSAAAPTGAMAPPSPAEELPETGTAEGTDDANEPETSLPPKRPVAFKRGAFAAMKGRK